MFFTAGGSNFLTLMLGWRYIVPSFWIILKRVQDHSPSKTSMELQNWWVYWCFPFSFEPFSGPILVPWGVTFQTLVSWIQDSPCFKHSRGHRISLSYFCFGLVFVFLSVSFMVAKECGTWHWCGEDWTWRHGGHHELYHQHFWWSWVFLRLSQKIISEQAKEKTHVKLIFFMF